MSTLSSHNRDSEVPVPKLLGDVLSSDVQRRGVELAFVARYTKASVKASRVTLRTAMEYLAREGVKDEMQAKVTTDLALMQSPAFAKLARGLEQELPADAGFGKFRGER